jgi:hypothetical protein
MELNASMGPVVPQGPWGRAPGARGTGPSASAAVLSKNTTWKQANADKMFHVKYFLRECETKGSTNKPVMCTSPVLCSIVFDYALHVDEAMELDEAVVLRYKLNVSKVVSELEAKAGLTYMVVEGCFHQLVCVSMNEHTQIAKIHVDEIQRHSFCRKNIPCGTLHFITRGLQNWPKPYQLLLFETTSSPMGR